MVAIRILPDPGQLDETKTVLHCLQKALHGARAGAHGAGYARALEAQRARAPGSAVSQRFRETGPFVFSRVSPVQKHILP